MTAPVQPTGFSDVDASVDPSATMVAAASGQRIERQVDSIYELPFADASLDAVRAECVLQHIDDPEAGLRAQLAKVTNACSSTRLRAM